MAKRKPLKDCIVKPGEKSPFANLLVDLVFKKAFDPDKPSSRENLVNLLNDLLEPQLKRPIVTVKTRNVAHNLSGSKKTRTAIFDLHCEDDMGNLIEIEVQIRRMTNFLRRLAFYASEMVANQAETGEEWKFNVKPTYVIAFAQHNAFDDDRIVHRATLVDLESGAQVPMFIDAGASSMSKWLFIFRYLNRLKELPAELDEFKFKHLTESSKVSNFSKEEFEAYRKMYHKEWDRNAMVAAFFEDYADEINAKVEERVSERISKEISERNREMAKAMRDYGDPVEKIAAISGLSVEEIAQL